MYDAQAKRGLVHQSWGQVMMQISAARDSLLRRLCNPKDAKKRAHWEVRLDLCADCYL